MWFSWADMRYRRRSHRSVEPQSRGREMTNNNIDNSGIGFVELLTIVFVVLKLCGIINWSWWWVISPIWISAIIFMVVLIGVLGSFIMLRR